MSDLTKCSCPDEAVVGIEYQWPHPESYDGVSEWRCRSCGSRVGRWSGRVLRGADDFERRFGREAKDP